MMALLLLIFTNAMATTIFDSRWTTCKVDQDCILLVGSGKEKHAGCRWLSVNKTSKNPYRHWEAVNGIVLIGSSCVDRNFDLEIKKLKARCVQQTCAVKKLNYLP